VFHLAALMSIPHSYGAVQSYVETNVLGTLNVLQAAREAKVGRVIVTSTSEVYGTAMTMPIAESHPLRGQSPYSATKIGADMLAESFVRSFDLPVGILRPFNVYGPRQSERAIIPTIIRQALDPDCAVIKIGDPTPVRDFTFVADTVEAFMAIGSSPQIEFGVPYNAGSGLSVTIGEVLELVMKLTGCGRPVAYDPQRLRPPKSEVRALLADSSRLAGVSGWRAAVKLSEGLERTIGWWRDRLSSGRVRRQMEYMA
jgi:nucleoside-diphosphate-sugar epimerase